MDNHQGVLISDDVWKIIELINKNHTENTTRLEHAVEKLADSMVSREEFNLLKDQVIEAKQDIKSLKEDQQIKVNDKKRVAFLIKYFDKILFLGATAFMVLVHIKHW